MTFGTCSKCSGVLSVDARGRIVEHRPRTPNHVRHTDGRCTGSGSLPEEVEVECIRDDSTDCDCPRCVGAEDRFWREQGED
jgi:hypothetical protein